MGWSLEQIFFLWFCSDLSRLGRVEGSKGWSETLRNVSGGPGQL